MFYPSVYVFNIWHAYDRAKVINSELESRGEPKPPKLANNLGFFTGLFVGMFYGLFWQFLISPVFSGVILGIIYHSKKFSNQSSMIQIIVHPDTPLF